MCESRSPVISVRRVLIARPPASSLAFPEALEQCPAPRRQIASASDKLLPRAQEVGRWKGRRRAISSLRIVLTDPCNRL